MLVEDNVGDWPCCEPSHGGMLTFAVADDAAGFEPVPTDRGSSLINMRDRLTVVGGELDVRSRPGTARSSAARFRSAEAERLFRNFTRFE